MDLGSGALWGAFGAIVVANLLLSGDNAVVIAMAARSLPPRQQKQAIFWGSAAAIVLRVVLTIAAVQLLQLPYLKLIGGLALIVIAAKLLVPDEDEGDVESASHLWAAVQIVVVADIVMSLDNVIAIAAAANGSLPLLILGLAISVPLIVAGAALIMALLTRLPILVWGGAALLGWIAGTVIATDPGVEPRLQALLIGELGAQLSAVLMPLGVGPNIVEQGGEIACGIIGIAVVLVVGSIWRRRVTRVETHSA